MEKFQNDRFLGRQLKKVDFSDGSWKMGKVIKRVTEMNAVSSER